VSCNLEVKLFDKKDSLTKEKTSPPTPLLRGEGSKNVASLSSKEREFKGEVFS